MNKYYRHTKSQNVYELVAIASHSETEEEMVVYKSLKDGRVWVRPRIMFSDTVKIGGRLCFRFSAVSEREAEEFRKKHI